MPRHYCLYCGDKAHLEPSYVSVEHSGKKYELLGMKCPSCDAEIIQSVELRSFLKSLSSKPAKSVLFSKLSAHEDLIIKLK